MATGGDRGELLEQRAFHRPLREQVVTAGDHGHQGQSGALLQQCEEHRERITTEVSVVEPEDHRPSRCGSAQELFKDGVPLGGRAETNKALLRVRGDVESGELFADELSERIMSAWVSDSLFAQELFNALSQLFPLQSAAAIDVGERPAQTSGGVAPLASDDNRRCEAEFVRRLGEPGGKPALANPRPALEQHRFALTRLPDAMKCLPERLLER